MTDISDQLDSISLSLSALARGIGSKRIQKAIRLARSGRHALACRLIEGHAFPDRLQKLEAALLLAKVYAQQGDFEKASQQWKEILRADPYNQEAISGLAAIPRDRSISSVVKIIGYALKRFSLIALALLVCIYVIWLFNDIDSHIASSENSIRSSGMMQESRILEQFKLTRDDILTKISMSPSVEEPILRKLELLDKHKTQRDQDLISALKEELSGIRNLYNSEQQKLDDVLARIKKQEAQSVQLRKQVNTVLPALSANLKLIRENLSGKASEDAESSGAIEKRLSAIEKQLEDIRKSF